MADETGGFVPIGPVKPQVAGDTGGFVPIGQTEPGFLQRMWQGATGQDVSRAGRLGMGMADPIIGAAQLAASRPRSGPSLAAEQLMPPEMRAREDARTPQTPEAMTDFVRQREERYQQGEKAAGLGGITSEWARVLGNLISPPSLAMGGAGMAAAPAGALGRIGLASGLGAVQGVTEPKPEGVSTESVLKGAGLGAAGGAVGGAAGEAVGSLLGRAIATNSPQDIEKYVLQSYRGATSPSRSGITTGPQMGVQDWRVISAVDDVIKNQANLRYTDLGGNVISQGHTPRTLRQFADALDQTKGRIFREYDAMARSAGQQGAQVDLAPVVTQLNQIATQPQIAILHPELVTYATDLGNRMLAKRFFSPGEAQGVIEDLNKTMKAFYKNPSETSSAKTDILAPVADILRNSLDQAIANTPAGPGYQALKHQYGALRSVEKDVSAAAQNSANKMARSGGIAGAAADVMASERVIHGILHLDPSAIATATGIKAAKEWMKRANDPNAAIARLFAKRAQPPAGPVASGFRMGLPVEGGIAGGAAANDRELRVPMAGP